MDLSQSFPRVVYVNGVFDFEGQGISYQPHDSIAFVMLQKKNVPIWPSKQNYWTSEARWHNKAKFGFKICNYFEVYIQNMDKVKELQIS